MKQKSERQEFFSLATAVDDLSGQAAVSAMLTSLPDFDDNETTGELRNGAQEIRTVFLPVVELR